MNTLLDHFELLTILPESTTKLKALILQLALRGKIVSQDQDDEPASELLKRIKFEEKKRISMTKIKRKNSFTSMSKSEIPYELPTNWQWCRLGEIISITSGDGLTSNEMVKQGDYPVYGGNGITGQHDKFNVDKPTIVIGRVGYYCGSIHLTEDKAWITDNAFNTSFSEQDIFSKFLIWLLKATNLKKNDSATAQPVISGKKIYPIPVPLPPLNEQKRIVAKVESLLTKVETLAKAGKQVRESRVKLGRSSLHALRTAKTQKQVQQSWTHLEHNFEEVFSDLTNVKDLRQTILQLAMQGKLVSQDPNDEPASELLKRIKAEKEKLIAEGKIKNEKPLPSIANNEIPYELPRGWVWCRLREISNLITKGSSPKWQGVNYVDNGEGVLFITSKNVGKYKLILDEKQYVEKRFNELEPRSILKKGDFLMNIVGASIGRTALFDRCELANINQAVCLIRIEHKDIAMAYFLSFFNSPVCINYMFSKQVDHARANLSMGNIARFLVPLPPFNEQKRIVAKVEQLMQLCDRLEANITQSGQKVDQLMRAILKDQLSSSQTISKQEKNSIKKAIA